MTKIKIVIEVNTKTKMCYLTSKHKVYSGRLDGLKAQLGKEMWFIEQEYYKRGIR